MKYLLDEYLRTGRTNFTVPELVKADDGRLEGWLELMDVGYLEGRLVVTIPRTFNPFKPRREILVPFSDLYDEERRSLLEGSLFLFKDRPKGLQMLVRRLAGISGISNWIRAWLGISDVSWEVRIQLTPMAMQSFADNKLTSSLEAIVDMDFPTRERAVVDYLLDSLAEARASACQYANLTVEDGICLADECDDVLSYASDYKAMPRWAGEVHGYGFSHQFPVFDDELSDFDLN